MQLGGMVEIHLQPPEPLTFVHQMTGRFGNVGYWNFKKTLGSMDQRRQSRSVPSSTAYMRRS